MSTSPKEERYLTVAQVAKRLHLHPNTVRRLFERGLGKLPGVWRTPGGHWRAAATTVQALERAATNEATP